MIMLSVWTVGIIIAALIPPVAPLVFVLFLVCYAGIAFLLRWQRKRDAK